MPRIPNGKKILIISNDPRHPSGVGNECRHICRGFWQAGYETIVLAYSLLPHAEPCEWELETGEKIKIFSTQLHPGGQFQDFGNLIRLITIEKPSALVLFDDPHRFLQLLDHTAFIRARMPCFFVHVWDTYLVPEASGINHFNAAIYENFDGIGCISKQTEWFVRNVMSTSRPSIFNRPKVAYVGHGSDPFVFNPLPSEELKDIRSVVTGDKEFDFIALAVNANQARKKLPDIVEAWRIFNSQISRAEAVKTLLVVKSQLAHDMGTDLNAVTRALAPNCNVSLIAEWTSDVELNKIYNVADVFVSASNSEGFGLTANEAILAGTPVILNAVGGLVDQMGFTNVSNPQYSTYNNWSPEFFADLRHMQTGPWCYPLFGQRTIIGSPQTPFLYELNASIESIANGFLYWHAASAESRTSWGQIGREWTLRQGLTGQTFATNVVRDVSALIADFKPRDLFQLFPV